MRKSKSGAAPIISMSTGRITLYRHAFAIAHHYAPDFPPPLLLNFGRGGPRRLQTPSCAGPTGILSAKIPETSSPPALMQHLEILVEASRP